MTNVQPNILNFNLNINVFQIKLVFKLIINNTCKKEIDCQLDLLNIPLIHLIHNENGNLNISLCSRVIYNNSNKIIKNE